ncbi:hypothetical protein GF385_02530 [Candidatus Dependentiae bacterium]|nr:hypothetical protein [Candidatus Dependentiae bacterium]
MKQRMEFLEKVKNKLLERREEMMQDLDYLSHDQVSDGQVKDSGDEALSLTLEKLKNSLEQSDIDELKLIDNALERLKKGEYGFCIDCQEPISSKRLETFPYAARCIVCQEAIEE